MAQRRMPTAATEPSNDHSGSGDSFARDEHDVHRQKLVHTMTTPPGPSTHSLPASSKPEMNAAHLDPAPQHPLFASTSPSRPSFTSSQAARLQRRRVTASDTNAAPVNDNDRSAAHDDRNPRGKSDLDRPKMTTLDRLEGWFGLGTTTDQRPSGGRSALLLSQPSTSKSIPARKISRPSATSSRLVLVHAVTPADSLDSLALRYNTDVRTLRRANSLWPGDSVHVRKEIYIPVDEDAAQGQGVDVLHASEEANGKLNLLNGQAGDRHSRSLSVTSASSSGATSVSHAHSSTPAMPIGSGSDTTSARLSPELRRVPVQSLSYFPPPGSTGSMVGKGKGKEQQDTFGFATGIKSNDDLDPGDSGVDDLLQLAERARLRGSDTSPPISPQIGSVTDNQKLLSLRSSASEGDGDQVNAASSPATSSRALEEEWKPNKWTLGQRRQQNASSLSHQASTSDLRSDRGPAMIVAAASTASDEGSNASSAAGYRGWNDIPEPPLHRTAKGQVAHAYKPRRRYPRPGIGAELPGSALIEDLAAGLPANPGPAANWARPIGDCLPLPPEGNKRAGGAGRSASPHLSASSNWGQILSDTVRGKIRLEDALERGLEDIRAGLNASAAPPPKRLDGRVPNGSLRPISSMQVSSEPYPHRPSAEMARAALADPSPRVGEGTTNSGAGDGGGQVATSTVVAGGLAVETSGGTMRRSSGRSLHELEDLRVQHGDEAEARAKPSHLHNTWSAASSVNANGLGGGGSDASSTTKGVRGRRNVRNVDWLG